MIFKRPYAFIIKYFKVINILLALLAVFIVKKSYNIIIFFNEYISHNYSGNIYSGFYSNYVTPILFIVLVLFIIGLVVLTLLFIYKKKPSKMYAATIIYYIILLIFINIIKNTMISMEADVITAESARIYRDLSIIFTLPQFYFIIVLILRGFGLSLNKFNFDKDIKELEVAASDNEEVELTFKGDLIKVKRNIRRFIREYSYYFLENKLIVSIIGLILIIIAIISIYNSLPKKIDNTINQGKSFVSGSFTYNITDSIVTNLNYAGETFQNDEYYLIAKLSIENNYDDNQSIDYKLFRLINNKDTIYPVNDQGINFSDYAEACYGRLIKPGQKQNCVLVFKINKKSIKKHYKIKIQNGTTYIDNVKKAKYHYINLNPIVIDKVVTEHITDLNQEFSFKNSNVGDASLLLKNPRITSNYTYDYEFCTTKNECNTYKKSINISLSKKSKILLVLEYEYNNNSKYSINKLLEKFAKIKYTNDNNDYYIDVRDVTPSLLKNEIVLEVSDKVKDLDHFYLSFIVRNKEYLVKIK